LSEPAAPRSGRGRPRTEGTRDRVIAALIALVAEQGYARTSMDEIAERAGVSKATIYRRWPSKEALMIEAHQAMLDESDVPNTGSLEGDLNALVDRMADKMEEESLPGLMQASVGEMLANADLAEAFRENVIRPRLNFMHQVFLHAIERGEAAPDVDWRSLAFALIGSNVFRVAFLGEAPDRAANRRLVALVAREARGEAER